MTRIVALLHCTTSFVSQTTLRQMSRIIDAMLSMTGRITMLGLSQWTAPSPDRRAKKEYAKFKPVPLLAIVNFQKLSFIHALTS